MGLIGKIVGMGVAAGGVVAASTLFNTPKKKLDKLDAEFLAEHDSYESEKNRLIRKINKGNKKAEEKLKVLEETFDNKKKVYLENREILLSKIKKTKEEMDHLHEIEKSEMEHSHNIEKIKVLHTNDMESAEMHHAHGKERGELNHLHAMGKSQMEHTHEMEKMKAQHMMEMEKLKYNCGETVGEDERVNCLTGAEDVSTCLRCGKQNDANANFCSFCGYEISPKKYCTDCGSKIVMGAKFCQKCGKEI